MCQRCFSFKVTHNASVNLTSLGADPIIFALLCAVHPQGFALNRVHYRQGLLFLYISWCVLESIYAKLMAGAV